MPVDLISLKSGTLVLFTQPRVFHPIEHLERAFACRIIMYVTWDEFSNMIFCSSVFYQMYIAKWLHMGTEVDIHEQYKKYAKF